MGLVNAIRDCRLMCFAQVRQRAAVLAHGAIGETKPLNRCIAS